jgi:hypothetical protein
VSYTSLGARNGLLDNHPEHDGGGEAQSVPEGCQLFASVVRVRTDVPSEDVLCVVVPQVDSGRPANGDTLWLALVVCEQVRNCGLVRYPISIHPSMHTQANLLIVSSIHTG